MASCGHAVPNSLKLSNSNIDKSNKKNENMSSRNMKISELPSRKSQTHSDFLENHLRISLIIITIIITIIKLIISQDLEILGWCPVGNSLISCGEGSSLALVGNYFTDGVLIMMWKHFKPTPKFMSGLYIKQTETNNVNGPQLAEQGPLSSRCSQQNIGRHHANPDISQQRKWSSQKECQDHYGVLSIKWT